MNLLELAALQRVDVLRNHGFLMTVYFYVCTCARVRTCVRVQVHLPVYCEHTNVRMCAATLKTVTRNVGEPAECASLL